MRLCPLISCVAALALCLALCACGGSGPTDLSEPTAHQPNGVVAGPWTQPTLESMQGSQLELAGMVPPARPEPPAYQPPDEFPGFPALPVGNLSPGRTPDHAASALTEYDPLSYLAPMSQSVTDNAASITLNSGTAGDGQMSYAMYGLTAPIPGSLPQQLNLRIASLTQGPDPDPGLWVLIANYGEMRWDIHGPYTILKYYNFLLTGGDFLSPGGDFYCAVLTHNGTVAEIDAISLQTNDPPIALIREENDQFVAYAPATFNFTGEFSTDADGWLVNYAWDLDEDGIIDEEGPAKKRVEHTFTAPGSKQVRLTVTDNLGMSDDTFLNVIVLDPDQIILPDEFFEEVAMLGYGAVPTPELNFDQTFEYYFRDNTELEWYEVPEEQDNIQLADLGFSGYTNMRNLLPDYADYYFEDHTYLPYYTYGLQTQLEAATGIEELLRVGANVLGYPVAAAWVPPALADEDPLANALIDFKQNFNEEPLMVQEIKDDAADIPLELQEEVAKLIYAIIAATEARNTFLAGFDSGEAVVYFDHAHGLTVFHDNPGPWSAYWQGRLASMDWQSLLDGAAILGQQLDEFNTFIDGWTPPGGSYEFDQRTMYGQFTISDGSIQTHVNPHWEADLADPPDGWYALLVDIGGDDTYDCHAGGNADLMNPVSLLVDVAGNDIYNRLDDPDDITRVYDSMDPSNNVPPNDNTHQQGSGRMGYGILYDLAGNDQYYSVRLSQGVANFGVGLLVDQGAGMDTYSAEAFCQGAAQGGFGALWDDGGDDTHDAIAFAQGFARYNGVGLLYGAGDGVDSYTTTPDYVATRPEYQSWPTSSLNVNYSQGVSLGNPGGSYTVDEVTYYIIGAGGLGILLDSGGSDTYESGVYGMAVGIFEATGMLIDLGGDDQYTSAWHSIAAAQNLGSAILWDSAGNDVYLMSSGAAAGFYNLGISGANDWALSWLLDFAGDDTYTALDHHTAAARMNGFAYLVDVDGTDTYTHAAGSLRTQLGAATVSDGADEDTRDFTPTVAVFCEVGGIDTYDLTGESMFDGDGVELFPGDGTGWVRQGHPQAYPEWQNYEFGIGWDFWPVPPPGP